MIVDGMQDFPLSLQHILWRMERLFPHKQVVTRVEGGVRRTSYGDMLPRMQRAAAALHRLGVRHGDAVGTLMWNNQRHLELYYAVPCMGAVIHTLNLRLPPDQLEFVIRDAGDRVIVVDQTLLPVLERLAGRLDGVERIIVAAGDIGAPQTPPPASSLGEMLDYETLLAAESGGFAWPRLDERAPAGICYSSGTTGNPKGAVYTHRSQFLHAMACLQASNVAITEPDVLLPVVPMFHVNAWGIPYAAGMSGASLVFPDRWMGDGEALVELTESERVTVLFGVPTIWTGVVEVLERTGGSLPSVRMVVCGGSAVSAALMERTDRLGLPMLHAWGMTETSPIGTVANPRSWHTPDGLQSVRLSQGGPVPGVEIRIADAATGEELPWDGAAFGELQCRGPWIARRYHNDAEPGRMTEDGWFRTGDVSTIDRDGFMRIVDRTKDLIKSGGEWISSVELENAIMAHPGVREAAVIGLAHSRWEERPVAYVVPRPEYQGELSLASLAEFLQERGIPRWWLPDEVRIIESVPKTSVGKFDKKALRAAAQAIDESAREAITR